jgi:hypothetical protein
MNCRKNVIWTSVLVSGLLLTSLSACSNDEPATTTGTPAPGNASSSTDVAPIAGSSNNSPSPSASSASTTTTASAAPASGTKPVAPAANPATKPLVAGDVKPDVPLPPKDVEVKAPVTLKPTLAQGGLSESQMGTMKGLLKEAKEAADAGKMDDAKNKFNEFVGGSWEEAAKELKTKSASKYESIDKAIKAVDAAIADKAKFSKAVGDLTAVIEKAKQ